MLHKRLHVTARGAHLLDPTGVANSRGDVVLGDLLIDGSRRQGRIGRFIVLNTSHGRPHTEQDRKNRYRAFLHDKILCLAHTG